MRSAFALLLAACAAWPQFRGTSQLVIAPTTIMDSRGHLVDSLNSGDLLLYDNNVLRPIQADMAMYPISLVVAVESGENSKAVLDKLGGSGILFSQLLAADQGETALISFSDHVTQLVDFTSDPDDLTQRLRRMRPDGNGGAALDGLMKALDMLAHRKPGRRLIVLMIGESRDRGSKFQLPEVVERAQQLNAGIYWLTYSTTWTRYTDTHVDTYGDIEDPKDKGKDKVKDETPIPEGPPPMDLLAPFTALAHLTRPNVANLFTRLTGAQQMAFLTKGALEATIHDIGDEIHRQYILTFAPAPGQPGLFHRIRVEVKDRPDLKVRTREGYWAIQ
ncbi:MAG TPA: VWA domain-containing protein [Bryobacteraceae bacterium]|nr:VWA domain-containing protein [Bryobacteraceae bacterium]